MNIRIGKIPILGKWIESQISKRIQEQNIILKKFSEEVRDVIIGNDLLLDAMAKQRILLLKQKRKPIAIFISVEVLTNIIWKIPDYILLSSYTQEMFCEGKIPITDIAKIPVYVNSLLTEAMLLVVGSIVWKSEVNNGK